jgi:hypothetical protein
LTVTSVARSAFGRSRAGALGFSGAFGFAGAFGFTGVFGFAFTLEVPAFFVAAFRGAVLAPVFLRAAEAVFLGALLLLLEGVLLARPLVFFRTGVTKRPPQRSGSHPLPR